MIMQRTNGVDFVHEDDAGLMVARETEHFSNQSRALADVLVHDGTGDHLATTVKSSGSLATVALP